MRLPSFTVPIVLTLALASCTGCDSDPHVVIPDPPDSSVEPLTCNPLTQAGCEVGQKCTWIVDAQMPQYVGHLGCAPSGAVEVGDGCEFGAPGPDGYDNCKAGLVCSNYRGGTGVCKTLCDAQGGTPTCDDSHVCVTYSGLFSASESAPPAAGVCDLACDPLDDNDFDGSGSGTKTGTTCGSGQGCYGYPSFGTPPATGWSCTTDINAQEVQDTGGLRHRTQCTEANHCADPGPTIYVNSCNQGYLPLMYEASGSTTVICVATCRPLNCYEGNCGSNNDNRLGEAPHRCNAVDRVGTFNTSQNGEHCEFLWRREVDDAGNYLPSPTSDEVGFCVDHSKYKYDSNTDNMPDTALPACATLPDGFGSGSAFGAADLGCVDSTHAGAFTGKTLPHRTLDLPRPLHNVLRRE